MSALDCDMLKLTPLFAFLYVRLEIIYILLINILIYQTSVGYRAFTRSKCSQVCAAVILGCRCGHATSYTVNK